LPYFGTYGFITPSHSHQIVHTLGGRLVTLALDEFVTVGETLDRAAVHFYAIPETIVVSEIVEQVRTKVRSLAEIILMPTRPSFTLRSFSTISFNFSDTPTLDRVVTKFRAITDTPVITVSDAAAFQAPKRRDLSETIVVSDALALVRNKVRALAESIGISDALDIIRSKFRTPQSIEAITISDLVEISMAIPRALADTITIGETLDRVKLTIRASADSISIGETLDRIKMAFRGAGIIPEVITITDSLTKIKTVPRALADTISLSEALDRLASKARALADTITISDLAQRGKFFTKTITETAISVAEHAIPSFVKTSMRSLADTITVGDSTDRVKTTIRALVDTIGITDAVAIAEFIAKEIAETITVSDSLTRLKSRALALADTIIVSDAVTVARVFLKNLADTIGISDALAAIKTRGLLIIETLNISDFVNAVRVLAGGVRWLLTGQASDFPSKIEDLVKTYVNTNWSIAAPALGSTPSSQAQIDNFNYDHNRTYYIKIKEVASDVETRQIRLNTYKFETPIEFDCYSRRLTKGESFSELNAIINELIRIFGTYQKEQIFGIQGVTFERISQIERERSAGQILWSRRLRIVLHYYKVSTIG
jgi:hypothetical protein